MNRTIKQSIYGFFYLVILGAIFYGVYSAWFRPAPSCFNGIRDTGEQGVDCGGICFNACVPSNISALEISEQPKIFRPMPSSVSVIVQIKNSNPNFAAENFPYRFFLRDNQDNVLKEIEGESFIYALETNRHIAEFNIQFPEASRVAYADFSIGQPKWVPASSFSRPELSLQNFNTSNLDNGAQVAGNFVNNGTVTVARAIVFAVFYNKFGQQAGISKSEVDDVLPGQQRPFLIFHPPIASLNLSGTKVYLYGN